ncbi:TonB-dependent receptor [Chitinophaga sp. MD30]|uniref:TonB-dependent receptor n=1 Tax=Chitinophaga sp. MD30 TaxID=2033437 RepID=UPI000BAEC70B|nr:TonB-dependent receptor [Chitinophaga sp. MD30]ASZ12483.1 TonB-dependent receptor [Chitinophaga sp. MD30]
MKHLLLLLATLLSHIGLSAQQFSIKGTVRNQRNTPVEFLYIGLFKGETGPLQQTVSDSLGHFLLKAPAGNYRMRVSHFGKEVVYKEIVLSADLDLGTIEIQEATDLQGITVTAGKRLVEQKVDRPVFNVENAIVPTGGTAMDALKATPGVRVQNDNVSIVGKGEVLVMVDGRLQRMSQDDLTTFLKSIPADNIKSIEVIATPPSQYQAEGNNGLININLKKARPNAWNANIGGTYTQKTYSGFNGQAQFGFNYGALSLQASLSKGQQQLRTTSVEQIFYPQERWRQAITNRSKSDVLSASLGIDYKLTSKWTTGVKYLGSFTDRTSANNPLTTRIDNNSQADKGYIMTDVNAANKPQMNSLNWYHTLTLDSTGKSIAIDVDFFSYRKQDYRFFAGNEAGTQKAVIPGTFFSATNTNRNRIDNYSAKADVTLPYKWANLTVGGRVSYTNTGNDLTVYDHKSGNPVFNKDQSNVFNYKEYNQAAYLSASKKINSHWETQLGIRMEATQTNGYSQNLDQTNVNNYIRLFPTAYITYLPDDNNTFSLNYSRRIRRPDFDYLNPFVIRTSPYFYSEGNPFLKPSYIDNVELSYVKDQKWASNLYYSRVTNFGQELSIIDSTTNITRQTPVNYANTYQLGCSTYYNFNSLSWWNSFTGFNVNYQGVKSRSRYIQSIRGYNAYVYSNNDFTVNKTKSLFFSVNYAVQLPGRYQLFHISNMHMLDVAVKFLLANKKLTLTITGEDLLNAQRPTIAYHSNGVKNSVRSYGDTRGFRISVSYKLGNNSNARQRTAGNEEERTRVN